MNDSVASNFTPSPILTFVEVITLLLANVLLAEDGIVPTRDVAVARRLLNRVFEGRKIACIKFIRTNTGMGLVQAKEFCEDHIWEYNVQDYAPSIIHRMQDRHNLRY